MGLKHLNLRVETVEVSDGGSFTVRGLNLIDITKLVEAHREPLSKLFDMAQEGMSEGILSDTSAIASTLFRVAPEAAIQIIGLGADEDDLDLVNLLPFPEQLDALVKIAAMTFRSQSPGKVLETIIRVTGGATKAFKSLSISPAGFGASIGK